MLWGTPGTLVVGACLRHPWHPGGVDVRGTVVFTLGTMVVHTLVVSMVAGGILGTQVGHTLACLGATVSYH